MVAVYLFSRFVLCLLHFLVRWRVRAAECRWKARTVEEQNAILMPTQPGRAPIKTLQIAAAQVRVDAAESCVHRWQIRSEGLAAVRGWLTSAKGRLVPFAIGGIDTLGCYLLIATLLGSDLALAGIPALATDIAFTAGGWLYEHSTAVVTGLISTASTAGFAAFLRRWSRTTSDTSSATEGTVKLPQGGDSCASS